MLDSTSFNDYTWLARGGFFHSDSMHVIEKLTRNGDQILYESSDWNEPRAAQVGRPERHVLL